MNRRNFFNILGKAVLGTVIALKIPDSIVPNIIIEKSKITIAALEEAYIACSRGAEEPSLIVVSEKTHMEIAKLFIADKRTLYFPNEDSGFKFRGANIIKNGMFTMDDNEIQVIGGSRMYSNGKFYF